MTVRENLMFPLKRHKKEMTAEELEAEVLNTLDSVGLKEAIDKMPSELSGGMRKRIGLARTLILKPELMLYDEPTTGLDTITSREISELILAIQKKNKTTSIIITHDMACAKLTSDRIVILKDGTINAEGTYEELEKSNDEWVRSFFI
jgi:phospholipid/cholesterol/gamma-HCH transport system ATP-binding protein